MLLQHSTKRREAKGEASSDTELEGIVVPLELGKFRILKQLLLDHGSFEVKVIT